MSKKNTRTTEPEPAQQTAVSVEMPFEAALILIKGGARMRRTIWPVGEYFAIDQDVVIRYQPERAAPHGGRAAPTFGFAYFHARDILAEDWTVAPPGAEGDDWVGQALALAGRP